MKYFDRFYLIILTVICLICLPIRLNAENSYASNLILNEYSVASERSQIQLNPPVKQKNKKNKKRSKKATKNRPISGFQDKVLWWFMTLFFISGTFLFISWSLSSIIGLALAMSTLQWLLIIIFGSAIAIGLVFWGKYGINLDIKFAISMFILAFSIIGINGLIIFLVGFVFANPVGWILGLLCAILGFLGLIFSSIAFDEKMGTMAAGHISFAFFTLYLLFFLILGLIFGIIGFWLTALILLPILLILWIILAAGFYI